jgi:hypothetical protein
MTTRKGVNAIGCCVRSEAQAGMLHDGASTQAARIDVGSLDIAAFPAPRCTNRT